MSTEIDRLGVASVVAAPVRLFATVSVRRKFELHRSGWTFEKTCSSLILYLAGPGEEFGR